jgi:hypothetical protein
MTPLVVAAWPAVSTAVVTAAAALGLVAVKEKAANAASLNRENSVEFEIENSKIASDNMTREEKLIFSKDDMTVVFRRDIRGKLKICVTGAGRTEEELKAAGDEIASEVTRQFIYNKVVSELKNADFTILDQEIGDDDTIRIHVRNWN